MEFVAGEVFEMPVVMLRMENKRADIGGADNVPVAVSVMAVETLIGVRRAGDCIVLRNNFHGPFPEIGNCVGEPKQLLVRAGIILDPDVVRRKGLKVRIVDRAGRVGLRHADCESKTTKQAGCANQSRKPFHE